MMSLQWGVVAAVLYAEIGFMMLLMLPWIRPSFWQSIFNSRIVRSIDAYSHVFVYGFTTILLLLFADAIREVRKYAEAEVLEESDHMQTAAGADILLHMRLFRAQRNLYISGFALFLAMIIKRTIGLKAYEASLEASVQTSSLSQQPAHVERPIDTWSPLGRRGVELLDNLSSANQGVWEIARNAYELAALKDPERAEQFAFIVCKGMAVLHVFPGKRYLFEQAHLTNLDAILTIIRVNPAFPPRVIAKESEFRETVHSAIRRHARSTVDYYLLPAEIVCACAEFSTPDWICACGPIGSLAVQNVQVLLDEAMLEATGRFGSRSKNVEVFLL